MKFLSKISIILAGSILLLHSVLPHQHHSEFKEDQHLEEHEKATSLLDFIKLAFHIDLGEDHLESYKVAQQEQIAFNLLTYFALDFSFEIIILQEDIQKFPAHQEKLHFLYLSNNLSLRGPPQIA